MVNFSNNKSFVYNGKDLEAMCFARNYHKWIYDKIQSELGNFIAEIGSGTGNFTEFLLNNENVKIDAFEPCEKMHKRNIYKNNPKVNCINYNFENYLNIKNDYYDSVIFINVLEHIKYDLNALKKAFDILKDNGSIIIFVPALKFLYSDFDKSIGHYRRYNKKKLERLVSVCGYKIIFSSYFDSFGIIPWFLFMKILRNKLSHKSTIMYDKLVVPLLRIIENIVVPPIGKNVLLIAKKYN